jgi:uncharacterized protein YlxW (UPF0749 family)
LTEQTPASGDGGGERRAARRRVPTFSADLLTDLFVHSLDPGYADAAERRRGRPDSGLRRALGRGGTAVALLVFGFLLSVAYQHVAAGAPEAARARARLAAEAQRQQDQSDNLERRAARLRDEVAAARDRALGGGAEAERLRGMEAGTGLAKVTGDGITVTLTDAPSEVDPVTGEPTGENLGQVLDRDLQRLTNALWASGAEAIAVDGQRLSPVSTIRAAGQAILVDFTPVTSPYQVSAIGPPDMRERFNSSVTAEQFRWLHDKYRMGFTVRDSEGLTLPAAPDPQLRYAKPPDGAKSPSPTGGGR